MGQFDRLIDQLFAEANDRATAHRFVAMAEREPQLGSRVEPFLREVARMAQRPDGTEMTPEESYDYMASFLRDALGTPDYLINQALTALGPGEAGEAGQVAQTVSPEARAYEREQAGYDIATFEMREDPASYWRTENQAGYRAALERRLAADAPPAATFVDDGAAAPDASAGDAPAAE